MPEEEPPWQADQDLGRDSDPVPLGLDGTLAASAAEAAVLTVGGMIQQICTTQGSLGLQGIQFSLTEKPGNISDQHKVGRHLHKGA